MGHVKNRLANLQALALKRGYRRCYFVSVASIENDMGTRFAQSTGQCKADTCRRPGDQGQFALQLE
jgi:hypothetical protein